MSKLVVTNIRLPEAEFQRYRQLAQAAGMSLSQFIRQKLVSGKANVCRIDVQRPREAEPIWQLRPLRKKEGVSL